MKNFFSTLLVMSLLLCGTAAEKKVKLDWCSTYAQAQETAKKQKKPIFLFFTGSDWCSWCKRIDLEIFSHGKFIRYANKNFVLYKADFPRVNKASAAVRAQNNILSKTYEIEGFPTIVITDANGKTLGVLGYTRGGPDSFIEQLSRFVKK